MFEDVSWIIAKSLVLGIKFRISRPQAPQDMVEIPGMKKIKITLIKEGFCALIENHKGIYRCFDERIY
jgi:hypothetical protein